MNPTLVEKRTNEREDGATSFQSPINFSVSKINKSIKFSDYFYNGKDFRSYRKSCLQKSMSVSTNFKFH
jgi:hypothetical protein